MFLGAQGFEHLGTNGRVLEPRVGLLGDRGRGVPEQLRDDLEAQPPCSAGASRTCAAACAASACARDRPAPDPLECVLDVLRLHRRPIPRDQKRPVGRIPTLLLGVGDPRLDLQPQLRRDRHRAIAGIRLRRRTWTVFSPRSTSRFSSDGRLAQTQPRHPQQRDDDPLPRVQLRASSASSSSAFNQSSSAAGRIVGASNASAGFRSGFPARRPEVEPLQKR